ncbi:MAG: alginate export family protein, partial [Pseudomonadota bacterium]
HAPPEAVGTNTNVNTQRAFLTTLKPLLALFLLLIQSLATAEDGIETAIKDFISSGKPTIQLRYRFEHVDDELVPANDAASSILRAAIGYETGEWNGVSVYAEMEHLAQLFTDDYREGGFDTAKAGLYPIVADPPGTELNRAWVRFTGIKPLDIKVGRQYILFRKAPFHRFMGNVIWRQNHQSFDAIRFDAKPIEGARVTGAYINKVQRIFGDDAPGAAGEFECDCYVFNAQYGGFKYVKLEAYSYLLDIENSTANALDTYGARANGAIPLSETFKFIYAGEFATQSDASSNAIDVDVDYYLAEVGLGIKVGQPFLGNLVLKFDYELLEGDGTFGFRTPLATAHAFQGWADRFLTTPADGIEDIYITAIASGVFGGKFIFSYHMLDSDNLSYEYGDEINVLYARKFNKHFTVGTKAAIYSADKNATSLARAGGVQNNDVTKVWVWLQFDY